MALGGAARVRLATEGGEEVVALDEGRLLVLHELQVVRMR
jgi:hypothetical protein